MKLKICGMKLNTAEVAALRPDYLGFIFWEHSSRYFNGKIPLIPEAIKKVGVFVDAPIEEVIKKVSSYDLEAIQLHGNESAEYCQAISKALKIKSDKIEIIKVFPIQSGFDFEQLNAFEKVCDYYLFDTKGRLPGGNGFTFDWSVLKKYPATKPFFLSGGIGLEHIEKIKEFMDSTEFRYCHAIDVNSKFELEPGLKKNEELEAFKKALGRKN